MKTRGLFLIMLLSTLFAVAQPPGGMEERKEKLEAAKVGMITSNLNLTSEQAQKFWPIYNEYSAEQKKIKKSLRELHSREPKTDDDYLKIIDDMIEIREKEVSIDKSYKSKFLKVITPKQFVELFRTEHEFKKMLIHRLEQHRPPMPDAPRNGGGRGNQRRAPMVAPVPPVR